MSNIFNAIVENNRNNGSKQVMSITTDSGEHRTYTYSQMFALAQQFAGTLTAAGVVRGDRVIIAAENSPEWNIAYLAIMSLGCTSVLIDASLPKSDLQSLIDFSDARCVFTSPKVFAKFDAPVSDSIPVLNILDTAAPFSGHLGRIADSVPPTSDPDEEVAFIIYSSGTTRTATGIMHTHEAMLGTTYAAMDFNKLTETEKMLVVIPNSHIYGVVTSMLGPLLLGGSMHFIESMTAENVLGAFAEYQPTVFSCVPRVFEMFAKQIQDKINANKLTATVFKLFFPICFNLRKSTGINLGKVIFGAVHRGFGGHIRILCAAGAPMGDAAMRFYFGVGMNLFLNYGLTETNVPVIANSYENYTTDSCGKPYSHVELRLNPLDDSGNSEIWMKTPFMMKGYFRDEAATAAAFEDGWFKTGDLAAVDAKGNISVVGRCKDNIVLSTGKKVTPDDIEAAYGTLRGVSELVVCGIPAPAGGYDEVHAFVVKEPTAGLTCADIEHALTQKGSELSQYMKIAHLHFVDEIPKTSLQKPKRYVLKKQIMEDTAPPAIEEIIDNQAQDPLDVVIGLIRRVHKTDAPLSADTRIFEDLGMDSLGGIDLDMLVEEIYGKSIAAVLQPQVTIGQLADILGEDKTEAAPSEGIFAGKFPMEKEKLDLFFFKLYSTLVRWIYRVEVTGLENLPKDNRGYIICPNHQTNFDFLWVTMRFTKERFSRLGCMAKKELFNSSFGSRLITRVCGMIPIDRDSQNSHSLALCKQKLKEGWALLIYPEGTRTRNGEMGEFKRGAAMLSVTEQVPI
ncbi:MAG: AMP-binding protein, partial [Angelakisella sp.]